MDTSGKKVNTSVFNKPNRRHSSQRRINQADRRNNAISVNFNRRSTTLSRRNQDRRFPNHSLEWIQLANTKGANNSYTCANASPRLGQFVDFAV